MGGNKTYAGYRAYAYLEPEVDYKAFHLTREINRVEPYVVPVSADEEKRALQLLENSLVISLHEHPKVYPQDMNQIAEYKSQGMEVAAYEGLSVSYMDAVFDNLMDGTCMITSKSGWKWSDVIFDLGMRLCDIAHQDFLVRCEKADGIPRAFEQGQIAFIPALESATMIENEVERIDILYGLGVRMMGLVYSESNSLGSGLKENGDAGLTEFGKKAVRRMNKVGMAVDVSHAGDHTALDAIELSEKPVFISHAGARALWNSKRLKPDEVLLAVASKGGIIGIEAAPHTTISKAHPRHDIESVMEHFEYCVNLVGIDHVGFGPDTLFGDHVGVHHAYQEHFSFGQATPVKDPEEFPRVPYVAGIENPAEAFPNIVRWLVKHGYSDRDIRKVIGENALNVLRQAW